MAETDRQLSTWRLTVAYHGRRFCGWQKQQGERSVQAELERALAALAGEPVAVRAAGRTDAGVHARGQTVSARFASRVPAEKMLLALASQLPDDISVWRAERLPESHAGFDAKRHSVGKRYVYRVHAAVPRDVFVGDTRWHQRGRLDGLRMQQAAQDLVGEHDYESFRSAHCDAAHARRFLWQVDVRQTPGDALVEIEVRGNAFCRNMVRVIAGTLVDIGRRRLPPDAIPAILAARDRSRAGVTAPAPGLTLEEVYYPDTAAYAGIPPGASFPGWPVDPAWWPPPWRERGGWPGGQEEAATPESGADPSD